ncbi:MAG TPA: DUF922 domain-containing protein [Flavipsychrobacter sp.]|nr:DUF922 domain-containing protein [Flavipsychrobacter sp.]
MRKLGLAVFFVFHTAVTLAQKNVVVDVLLTETLQQRNEVSYAAPLLSWDDFKGRPDENTPWTAVTYSGIKLRCESKLNSGTLHLQIKLFPYMDRSRSWYKASGHNNYTLSHEQRHFDITILVTRQLAEALQQATYSYKTYNKQIDAIHDAYLRKLNEMQDLYDKETDHGMKRSAQRAWDRDIAQKLAQYAVN